MNDSRVLCPSCLADYIRAGYSVERDYSVKVKDGCEKCNRPGWAYKIKSPGLLRSP